MNNVPFATITDLKKRLANKEFSQRELLQFFLDRFSQYDADLGSALEIFDAESILKNAKNEGMLAGIPGILKDNIAQEGRALTCASKILQNMYAVYDATATARLKQQGALLIGRANMDEFAMGSSTETSAYHKTANPWDMTRVSGGSSGGSIAAVAAGLVPWALGSETGGSVRQPAAFCGIVGLKPTYGLVSRYGLVAYASSLDQIGVATRTVHDNALVFSAIAGHDNRDSSSLSVPSHDYTQLLDGTIKPGMTIGVVDDALYAPGMDNEIVTAIEQAVKAFEGLGAKIKRLSIPSLNYSAAAYFILSRAEAASNLARFDGVRYGLRKKGKESLSTMYNATRHDGFGPEVRTRIMVGNYVLSVGHAGDFYDNAKRVQQRIRRDVVDVFKDIDVFIMPTHPQPAFKFGAYDVDKLQMDLQDYFTCFANLAGVPAISVPCGFTKNNLPIGFQIIGPHLSEALLYKTAYAYEQKTEWHTQHPKGF
jgi:aspartyl-tRNA(Asn)/glutamyl-tRNA(Gln) amidotransferase subunit A